MTAPSAALASRPVGGAGLAMGFAFTALEALPSPPGPTARTRKLYTVPLVRLEMVLEPTSPISVQSPQSPQPSVPRACSWYCIFPIQSHSGTLDMSSQVSSTDWFIGTAFSPVTLSGGGGTVR